MELLSPPIVPASAGGSNDPMYLASASMAFCATKEELSHSAPSCFASDVQLRVSEEPVKCVLGEFPVRGCANVSVFTVFCCLRAK